MRRIFDTRRMMKAALLGLMVLAAAAASEAQLVPNLGGQRAGISAFQFLKIGAGARGSALGESFVAIANDATATYWNPAGLTEFSENEVIATHTWYVVDLGHEAFAGAYHLSPSDALGFSVISLHTADMPVTTETQPFGTGAYFKYGDLAMGLSYAKKMTDQFSFGVTVRYVDETLDVLHMRGIVADLGTYYWTGIGSSRFAVVVSNFGADVSPSGEVTQFSGQGVSSFQSFSPPTQFKIGFAMEPLQKADSHVTTSLELNHPNDNAENVHLGIEYQWEQWLWFRGGVKRTIGERLLGRDDATSNDVTFGLGVAAPVAERRVLVDYAFANYNTLGGVHRISLGLTF